jgi:hypothetical protein
MVLTFIAIKKIIITGLTALGVCMACFSVSAQTTAPVGPKVAPPPAGMPTPPSATAVQNSNDAFNKADKNKDGKLSKDELQALPDMLFKFGLLDVNHDGSLDRLEFASGFNSSPQQTTKTETKQVVKP